MFGRSTRYAAAALTALGLLAPGVASAKPGDIIVGDSTDSTVLRLDPKSGDVDTISDDPLLAAPNDSVFAPDGTLYVADYEAFGGAGGVLEINPKTGATKELVGGAPFEQPDGIALAPNGDLWVTDLDAEGGALIRVRLPGAEAEVVSSVVDDGAAIEDPVGVVVPPDGVPVVATFVPGIVRVDQKTGEQDLIAGTGDGLTAGAGLTRAADGTLYTNSEDGLDAVDQKTGEVTPIPSGDIIPDGYGLATDLRGHVIAQSGPAVLDFNPMDGNDVEQVGPDLGYPEGFEVEPPSCFGRLATIVGSPGNDKLKGSSSDDVIVGLGGKDKIKGLGGKDRICGGDDRDKINGGEKRDKCDGQKGRDKEKSC